MFFLSSPGFPFFTFSWYFWYITLARCGVLTTTNIRLANMDSTYMIKIIQSMPYIKVSKMKKLKALTSIQSESNGVANKKLYSASWNRKQWPLILAWLCVWIMYATSRATGKVKIKIETKDVIMNHFTRLSGRFWSALIKNFAVLWFCYLYCVQFRNGA